MTFLHRLHTLFITLLLALTAVSQVPSAVSRKRSGADPVPSKRHWKVQEDIHESGTLKCPAGFTTCPISPLDSSHECVNIKDDLENCGKCGNICGKGKGERHSSCTNGVCVVSSCRPGYILKDGFCERDYSV